jgi:hypothetical protein
MNVGDNMETVDLSVIQNNQLQIIDLLQAIGTNLTYITGIIIFFVVVVLCVYVYKFFSMFFK